MSDEVPLDVQNHAASEQQGNHFLQPDDMEQDQYQQPTLFGRPQDSGKAGLPNHLQELEAEAAKLRELNSLLDKILQQQPDQAEEDAARTEADSRSIYVGNVDYGTTPVELQQHFSSSGDVERVTILTNKHTGQPKGFAYLEFALEEGANKAVASLDGSTFRNRELKVSLKRTNIPGLSARGGPRGRGRGRGGFRARGRAGFRGRGSFRGGTRFNPY